MLVVTRNPGESIIVGNDIEFIFLGADGNKGKIGIIAPATVKIYRKELYLRIKEENLKALQSIGSQSLESLKKASQRKI